jgi:hypothetical protein
MRIHSYQFATLVILSVAKDLTQAFLITLRTQRATSSVGEVPHSVRDDARSARSRVRFASSP